MPRPISATILLSSLSHNLHTVARQLGQVAGRAAPNIWAVIKANAYGHGIDNAVQGFQQAQGLAMLDLDEAIRCRDLGWDKPILLLEGFFQRSEEHTSELQSLMRISYAVFCLKKKNIKQKK